MVKKFVLAGIFLSCFCITQCYMQAFGATNLKQEEVGISKMLDKASDSVSKTLKDTSKTVSKASKKAAKKTSEATKKSFDKAGSATSKALDKVDEQLDKAGKSTSKVLDKADEGLNKTTQTINKKINNASDAINSSKNDINREIEEAKKEMDIQADSLQDIQKQSTPMRMTQIFETNTNEQEMEELGKTFWTRKPIHPIAKYGYKGQLPDIVSEFDYKQTKDEYKCLIPTNPVASKQELLPVPRDDKAYVDIVIKRGSSSQYISDVNDVIFILQKLVVNIEDDVNVQRFNAQVSGLLDNIFYIQDKYKNKPESNYISFTKMIELASIARDTAILRTEAQAYSKYLAYSGEGAQYRPERIQRQMDYFLAEINKTLIVLKAVN